MTEELLDLAQVGAHVEQMGGVAVPQAMGMHPVDETRGPSPLPEHATHVAHAQPMGPAATATQGDEERLGQQPRCPPRVEIGR